MHIFIAVCPLPISVRYSEFGMISQISTYLVMLNLKLYNLRFKSWKEVDDKELYRETSFAQNLVAKEVWTLI